MLTAIGILFVALKLSHLVNCSWVVVLLPFYLDILFAIKYSID